MPTVKELQQFLGVTADGIFGAKSQAALDAVLRPDFIKMTTEAPVPGFRPASLQWPLEAEAADFYGKSDGSPAWEAAHLATFPAPYPLYIEGTLVRNIRCHKLVLPSLQRILTKIRELYPTQEKMRASGMDQYDGCYSYRPVRGSTRLSMHAYGAAVDFDSEHNPLGATSGRMPAEVVAIFKAEGWRWGGDYTGRRDLQHFEACR